LSDNNVEGYVSGRSIFIKILVKDSCRSSVSVPNFKTLDIWDFVMQHTLSQKGAFNVIEAIKPVIFLFASSFYTRHSGKTYQHIPDKYHG